MSKLYVLNRMTGSPAAGNIFTSAWKFIKGGIKTLTSKKGAQVVVQQLPKSVKDVAKYVAPVVVGAVGAELMSGGGEKESRGATGGWTGRRRRGITATELKGFHKVARLLHKEGMVVKHARR